MNKIYTKIGQKAFFLLDAETAHGLSIKGLKLSNNVKLGRSCANTDERLAQDIAGLHFPNPLGLAAGYDKNSEVPLEVLNLGFGFTEVGTITPLPQAGNPKPRIFRLKKDKAVINRLGFNNDGHTAALERLNKLPKKRGLIGINIGANKDSADRTEDYVKGIELFYQVAGYFTANVSSPNTPGLRDLQAREGLSELLTRIIQKRDGMATKFGVYKPIFLKIAPDLTEEGLDDMAAEASSHALDGLIISNTTLSRSGLIEQKLGTEAGGVSGKPVFERSNIILAKMRKRLGVDFPLIGVGGVDDTESAAEKFRAGADLIQLYTGLIYQGPNLPNTITRGLTQLCDRDGLKNIKDIRDQKLDHYADKPIPE